MDDTNHRLGHSNLPSSGVRYKISSGNIGNVFAIRNTTGALYVAKALDYEKIKKYELRLTASDNFKENYTTVLINVRDVNDNPPVFEKSSYRTQITEEDDRGLPKRVLRKSNYPYGVTGTNDHSRFSVRTEAPLGVMKMNLILDWLSF
uniref:Cadherin domain-containing protein n=1 Tax=Anopheles farauti TaxID=69004 RepID=A0A182Q093_9DIPT